MYRCLMSHVPRGSHRGHLAPAASQVAGDKFHTPGPVAACEALVLSGSWLILGLGLHFRSEGSGRLHGHMELAGEDLERDWSRRVCPVPLQVGVYWWPGDQ